MSRVELKASDWPICPFYNLLCFNGKTTRFVARQTWVQVLVTIINLAEPYSPESQLQAGLLRWPAPSRKKYSVHLWLLQSNSQGAFKLRSYWVWINPRNIVTETNKWVFLFSLTSRWYWHSHSLKVKIQSCEMTLGHQPWAQREHSPLPLA